MTYSVYCVGWGVKLYSLTHASDTGKFPDYAGHSCQYYVVHV